VGAIVALGLIPHSAKALPPPNWGPPQYIVDPGANIFASGSQPQGLLQNGNSSRWSGLTSIWHANPVTDQTWKTDVTSMNTYFLTGDPTITYTPTSSGAGLAEFGNSSGTADLTQDPVADGQSPPVLDGFVGTDDAPTASQMQSASDASGGVGELTMPVAQTPVALIFSLPVGVTIGSGGRIGLLNNGGTDDTSTLQALYNPEGVFATHVYPAGSWGAFLTRVGLTPITSGTPTASQFLDTGSPTAHTGGYQPLQLEVRSGDASTTDVFQTFLSISGDSHYSHFGDAERNWPTDANDGAGSNGYPVGPFGANVTGAALVKNTLATPGTVGYADLADAVFAVPGNPVTPALQTTTYGGSASHQYLYPSVQSDQGGTGQRQYAEPGTVATVAGNLESIPNLYTGDLSNIEGCNAYSLTQPAVGNWCVSTGSDYQSTFASDPAVYQHSQGVNAYPIAEIAYDVTWGGVVSNPGFYTTATNARDTENTVASYFAWVAKPTGGQAALTDAKAGWEQLPSQVQAWAASDWEALVGQ
jgi:hypothetical protein